MVVEMMTFQDIFSHSLENAAIRQHDQETIDLMLRCAEEMKKWALVENYLLDLDPEDFEEMNGVDAVKKIRKETVQAG